MTNKKYKTKKIIKQTYFETRLDSGMKILFKKVTGKTFTHFVNEYRLVHASKLLADTSLSITDVCFESGFNNFSHFNKQFKEFTGKSPSDYRKEIKQVISS